MCVPAWRMRHLELQSLWPFFTYYIYVGMYCLYPNLENKRAFVASWNEQGEHDPGDMKV
jgi:hypothetical protein